MSKELPSRDPSALEFDVSPEVTIHSAEALNNLANKNIVLLGIPGSGKTTLANNLRSLNENISYISVGDISRSLDSDSDERRYIDQLFAQGSPVGVPEFFLKLIEPYVDEAISSGKGFMLDGIPKKSSEIEPLIDFIEKKGIKLDAVVSCELDDVEAYNRLANRPTRRQDDDSMEVFTNRTALYLTDLSYFKESFTRAGASLHVLKTDELDQEQAVESVLEKFSFSSELEELIDNVVTAAETENVNNIAGELGYFFDETLTGRVNYPLLLNEVIGLDEKLSHVETAYLEQDPELAETPLFLNRLAENYLNNTVTSLRHLADSLIEEVEARGERLSTDNITELLTKQLRLKASIAELQDIFVTGRDIAELVEAEMQANQAEFSHIETCINKLNECDYDNQLNIGDLAMLQSKFWSQFTSKNVLFTAGNNYRAAANGQPGSHHSLIPYTHNHRALTATSMAEYTPFVEAVSATEYKYQSTFGFIHFMGMDKTGEAYGAEYPIMMHDDRLLDLNSEVVNEILRLKGQVYSNHDLWHNLVPVYAAHFILHHPDAPLSYGGRLPAYDQFGTDMRQEKEEYEIGMAMAHAKTQQELFESNPELYQYQVGLVHKALDMIPAVEQELLNECSAQEIQDIADYLAKTTVSSLYNVLPASDPAFEAIDAKLKALGLSKSIVDVCTVAQLLYDQRLIDNKKIQALLGSDTHKVKEAIGSDSHSARLVLNAIDRDREDKESGAEYILDALNEFGLLDNMKNGETTVELDGLNEVRWIAMMAPQRQALKGHMEKSHGKNGVYKFGGYELSDVRQLVVLQKAAIGQDSEAYNRRLQTRRANQRNSYGFYSLLFDDEQELLQDARRQLSEIRTSADLRLKEKAVKIVKIADLVIDSLVKSNYDAGNTDIQQLKEIADDLPFDKYNELRDALSNLADNYLDLRQSEIEHQTKSGFSYSAMREQLEKDQMDIV